MGIQKYTGKIEKTVRTEWIKKQEFIDKEVDFQIEEVQSYQGDMVLKILEKDKTQPILMRVADSLKNELVDLFGSDPDAWTGQYITLKFVPFTPKEGSSVSAGVQAQLVKQFEEEEEIVT